MKNINIIVTLILMLQGTNLLYADIFQQEASDRFYKFIKNSGFIAWQTKKEEAQQSSIYFISPRQATITADSKNNWFRKNIIIDEKMSYTNKNHNTNNLSLNWLTEKLWNYKNWNPPEPNDTWLNIEDYPVQFVDLYTDDPGKWYSAYINPHIHHYIKEFDISKKKIPLPQFASLFLVGITVLGIIGKLTHEHFTV